MRVFLLTLLLVPLVGVAAPLPAGFPSSSLWLSKTSLTEGENVVIYTVVYNSSDTALKGEVVFMVDGAEIGKKSVESAPGTTQIVSHAWTATEGTHSFGATLEGAGDTLAFASAATTTVSVAPKPPPPESVKATVETVSTIENVIASTTPIVQNVASTTFAATENIRHSTLSALERLASSTTSKGEVLGTQDEMSDEMAAAANAAIGFDIGGWIQNMWQALLGALLFVARSPLWFYITAGAILLIILQVIRTALSDRRHARGR